MKKISLSLLLIYPLLLLNGCKLADIRTEGMKKAIDAPVSSEKGRGLLQTAALAHGADRWENYHSVTFDFKDQFMKLKIVSPFPGGNAHIRLDYVPDSYDGRLTVLDGKLAGEQWGLSDFHSWKKKADGEIVWKHDKNIKFWLPTYQYFIQLPIKILEADFLRYGGKRKVSGTEYDIVFASWNTDAPQKELDQYALYLNPSTHLIDIVEFTVRGAGSWIRGACFYEKYTEVEGIQIPGVMTVIGPKVNFEDRSIFHRMEIMGTEFNAVDEGELSIKPGK